VNVIGALHCEGFTDVGSFEFWVILLKRSNNRFLYELRRCKISEIKDGKIRVN